MNLNDLREMIIQDSVIDKAHLEEESIKISSLHGKYLGFYSDERKTLIGMEKAYKQMRLEKVNYYMGRCPDEVYISKPLHQKIPRQDLDFYLEGDDELSMLKGKLSIQQEKCTMIKMFIDAINQRTFNIKNLIQFLQWSAGK